MDHMGDVSLNIYDFCEKYRGGAESNPELSDEIRSALVNHTFEGFTKFSGSYSVEEDEFESKGIDLCEKLMLVTDSRDDCHRWIVSSIALIRSKREKLLASWERERIAPYPGTLGKDIKKLRERAAELVFCYQPKLFFRMLPGLLFLLMTLAMLFLPALRDWFLDPAIEGQVGALVGIAAVTAFIVCTVKLGGRSFIRSVLCGFGCCILTMLVLAFLIGLLDGMADPGPYVLAIFATFSALIGLWLIISAEVKAARVAAYNRGVEFEKREVLAELDRLYDYARACNKRARFLQLDCYVIEHRKEHSNVVQYYSDIVHQLETLKNSWA